MKHRFATSFVAAALATSAGCALLAGVDGERHLDDAPTTSSSSSSSTSSSSSSGAGGSDAAVCSPVGPPPPPSSVNGGGATVLTFALHAIDIGGPNKKVGFDLDGECTCPGKTACKEPSWSKADHCDGPDGRDNGTGNAFATINQLAGGGPISSIALSQQADSGAWSLLIKISDYNDGDDDDQVEVAVYATPGLGAKPAWNGADAWPVLPSALADGTTIEQPIHKDPKAYVTKGVLVGHLPAITVVFLGGGAHLQVDLTAVVFSATLEKKAGLGTYLTAGTLAGFWTIPALFQGLSGLRTSGNTFYCTDNPIYGALKPALCDEIDLSTTGKSTADCDALSFGVGFNASPVLLGVVQDSPALAGGCPAATDPTTDDCSK